MSGKSDRIAAGGEVHGAAAAGDAHTRFVRVRECGCGFWDEGAVPSVVGIETVSVSLSESFRNSLVSEHYSHTGIKVE